MTDKINPWKISTLILAAALVLCISWIFFKEYRLEQGFEEAPTHVAETDEEYAELLPAEEAAPSDQDLIRKAFSVNKGDTFFKILQDNGIAERQAYDIL
nr:hypothetical protein [Deltaproteobacteria bacterium]